MRTLAKPVVEYMAAVLGVIAIASLAASQLHATAAKTHRHRDAQVWDANIDRIIAQQQEKKRLIQLAASGQVEIPAEETGRQIAALTRGSLEDDDVDDGPQKAAPKKAQGDKKSTKRTDRRRQQYIPVAFATLPKFAITTAASTTTTLLRLR
jgi:hypothetical protein